MAASVPPLPPPPDPPFVPEEPDEEFDTALGDDDVGAAREPARMTSSAANAMPITSERPRQLAPLHQYAAAPPARRARAANPRPGAGAEGPSPAPPPPAGASCTPRNALREKRRPFDGIVAGMTAAAGAAVSADTWTMRAEGDWLSFRPL